MSLIVASVFFTTSFVPTADGINGCPDLFDEYNFTLFDNFTNQTMNNILINSLLNAEIVVNGLGTGSNGGFKSASNDSFSINYLSNLESMMQSPFWASMLLYECVCMGAGWENPFVEGGKAFTLKDGYQPGNLFSYDAATVSETLYNNELSHGRLAMLTCAHIIGSEVLTGKGMF